MQRFIVLVLFVILLGIVGIANATTLDFTAHWTPPTMNADGTPCTDLGSYKVYRTDSGREVMCTVVHPIVECSFSVNVPDGSQGQLSFVATALDLSGNESADSNTVTKSYDENRPGAPIQLIIDFTGK